MAGILAQGWGKCVGQRLGYLTKAGKNLMGNGWDTCPRLGEMCWAMAEILAQGWGKCCGQWLEYLLKADRKGLSNGWDTCSRQAEKV